MLNLLHLTRHDWHCERVLVRVVVVVVVVMVRLMVLLPLLLLVLLLLQLLRLLEERLFSLVAVLLGTGTNASIK